ncbi:MAG TPA: sulfotransferase [Gammaproteobacteria bacterium]|nr:sulfotransferase [Gammaproteobacteria bacterium]
MSFYTELSPQRHLDMFVRAFAGSKRARRLHRRAQANGQAIGTGLQVIRKRWPDAASRSTAEPIFIFSAGWRSGSTLLQRLVAASTDIFMWGEPYRRAALIEGLADQVRAFNESWPQDRYFVERFDLENLSEQWVANLYPSMDDFIAAHVCYFECLFERPLAALGKSRWGAKEVTLGVDYARYLKWLFPRARFLFLVRNPWSAWRSYRQWAQWYRSWPSEPVFTPTAFGRLWSELADDFRRNHGDVDGLLLRYEDLFDRQTLASIAKYLQTEIVDPAGMSRIDRHAGMEGAGVKRYVPRIEQYLLKRQVGNDASRFGYQPEMPAQRRLSSV